MSARIDWIALIVSVLAATFSGLQWFEARQQRQLQFAATLVFDIETELVTRRRAGIAVRNVGPGIARIRSVTYYLDGKELDDPLDGLAQAKLDPDRDEGVVLGLGDSMAAGEIDWLMRYPIRHRDEEKRATDLVENRLQIAVDYCSAGGNCARACSVLGGCTSHANE